MARDARQAPDPVALEHALRTRPHDFEFFEAMRRLECAYPARPRLAHSTRPAEDPVRLAHTAALDFPSRGIDRYEPGTAERPPKLYGLFLGLFGPNGALPLHLTEYALERERHAKDPTLVAFADIFHHRMLSLFYRAWADAQPTVQFDRPEQDRFRTYIGALIGMATPHLEARDALPDQYKRFFAGRLVPQARNAEGLQRLLEHFFNVPVRVLEFVAEWMRLPADAHLRLGVAMAGIGRTAVLGAHVRGAQQRFRLRVGPLSLHEFNRFLPGSDALKQFTAAVRTYVGDEKDWDLQLVLKKEEVPLTHLGRTGRMGLNTWLGRYAKNADADEAVLNPVG
ncbi:type VI secretion system baseplate subunit TssG [Paraburkholderia rhizosphaerae]|uniref:Type VI secretion system protein ImpH n=1 Tax=Paraburkholderia rhizosphaerae TaxID=480658 RepID=A0A4R8LZ53_9BURK|nr:type VI secretion system baseplate subunit TssG [Paraburkholderia rhizosphaerae]TDY52759.1 type VI secretion system protein ImpH [Paraburkholderia rhizosphaerae]